MKIFICDDEPKILSDISSKVNLFFPEAAVSEYTNGKALLEAIAENNCDILLLDIDMPERSADRILRHGSPHLPIDPCLYL